MVFDWPYRMPGRKDACSKAKWQHLSRAYYHLNTVFQRGFIAHCENDNIGISPQLDIIIYDALRGSPLVRYDTCSVFPLESVYGYIEVKASLDSQSLSDIITKNRELRRLKHRWYWDPLVGSPPTAEMRMIPWLSVRSFVFSFDSRLKGTGRALARRLQSKLIEASEAHLHGVFIAGRGLFSPHRVPGGNVFAEHGAEFFFTNVHPLTAFKVLLLKCLATFPRYPIEHSPAVDRYHYDFVELSESV
jgi:hypothetical protein